MYMPSQYRLLTFMLSQAVYYSVVCWFSLPITWF